MQDDTSAVFRLVHDYPLYRFRTRAGAAPLGRTSSPTADASKFPSPR